MVQGEYRGEKARDKRLHNNNNNNNSSQTQTLRPRTDISLHIPSPPPQSQSTLYNHQSTHLPLPLLFRPVSGRLALLFRPVSGRLALLPLQTFRYTVRKSKRSYTLSEMSHFGHLQKSVTFGVPKRNLRDAGTEIFKTYKTGTVQGKSERNGSLIEHKMRIGYNLF